MRGARPRRGRRAVAVPVVVLAVAAGAIGVAARTVGPLAEEAPVPVDGAELRRDVETYLAGTDPTGHVRAVLVEVDGELVLEHYVDAGREDFFDVRSVTKSVVSAAIGIAIEDGDVTGVDATLAELLPDRADDMSPAVADVTLEQVLTHTAGFPEDDTPGTDWWAHEDRVGAVLAAGEGPSDPPRFAYSSGGSHLLAAVLVEATGESVLDYAGRRLLDPLGVPRQPVFEPVVAHDLSQADGDRLYDEYMRAGFAWPRDPQGVHDGGCCMRVRPVDLLALGRLHLAGGRVDGEQVVPASWVETATRAHVPETRSVLPGYGYQWWVADADGHEAAVAFGYGGQMVEVVPSLDLVVAVVTEVDDRDPMQRSRVFGPDAATYMVELAVLPNLVAEPGGAP